MKNNRKGLILSGIILLSCVIIALCLGRIKNTKQKGITREDGEVVEMKNEICKIMHIESARVALVNTDGEVYFVDVDNTDEYELGASYNISYFSTNKTKTNKEAYAITAEDISLSGDKRIVEILTKPKRIMWEEACTLKYIHDGVANLESGYKEEYQIDVSDVIDSFRYESGEELQVQYWDYNKRELSTGVYLIQPERVASIGVTGIN